MDDLVILGVAKKVQGENGQVYYKNVLGNDDNKKISKGIISITIYAGDALPTCETGANPEDLFMVAKVNTKPKAKARN